MFGRLLAFFNFLRSWNLINLW